MTKILTVSAHYPRPAAAVFAEALNFEDMAEATRGVATYKDLPKGDFEEGKNYTLNVTVWGVMRNPNYQVHVEKIDHEARLVQSREFGWMIRTWDHTLSVDPEGDGCRWTDRIEVDCSWATGFMTWVGKVFYRKRHVNRGGSDIIATITRV